MFGPVVFTKPSEPLVNRTYVAVAILLALMCVAVVAAPQLLLNPFSEQSAGDLARAYRLRQAAGWITLVCLVVVAFATFRFFRASRSQWSRTAMVVPLGVIVAASFMARANLFEHMFAPLPDPGFATLDALNASDGVGHVDPHDMVLGVRHGGVAKAYPVSQLAYHHLVNDEVDGVPLVATY